MDLYFIVAELELPKGTAAAWRAAIIRTPRAKAGTTLDAVIQSAEGPVRLDVHGDRVSLRAFLIDSAYFMVKDELEAALGAAKGKGQWYSGDHVSGTLVTVGKKPRKVMVHELPADVSAWITEAHELDTPAVETRKRAAPKKAARSPKRPR